MPLVIVVLSLLLCKRVHLPLVARASSCKQLRRMLSTATWIICTIYLYSLSARQPLGPTIVTCMSLHAALWSCESYVPAFLSFQIDLSHRGISSDVRIMCYA